MDWSKVFAVGSTVGKKAAGWSATDDGKKFLFGTYTDGTPRSFIDSLNDEIMSPKSRNARMRQIEERRKERDKMMSQSKKKKKKSKKKGKKKHKDDNDFWMCSF